jgi:DNA mismatch repair protein MutS
MAKSPCEIEKMMDRVPAFVSKREDSIFRNDMDMLLKLYTIVDSDAREKDNLDGQELTSRAINGLLNYITETQKIKLEHINKLEIYEVQKYMALDINTRRSLEITERMRDKSKKGTLINVLDKTSTSMGGRLLRRWLNDPLLELDEINKRHESVSELKNNIMLRGELIEELAKVYDIERLTGKISYGSVNARELNSLKNSLEHLPALKQNLSFASSKLLKELYQKLDELQDIVKLIDDAIVDEPPISLKDGGIIKDGYNSEIDEYKNASRDGKNWIIALEARERELTGIPKLKVGYTKAFGYYIEVSKSFMNQVPQDRYIRKQTLTTGERYITEELRNMEGKILGAEEKVINLEYLEFVKIRDKIAESIERLQLSSSVVATVDVLCSFAKVAEDNNYVCPEMSNNGIIDIKDGRHPVIEKMIDSGTFVQNDTYLDKVGSRLAIITGPNMAGKSTYMRQVALIVLMAQCGSFVPASSAKLGIVDKIFTRVGAQDDLSSGQSTFMVEMMEVSNILKNATPNSLVILDEIGRGTSTYDGLSIAWAVAEYIADKTKLGCKTLFATHYHELIEMGNKTDGIKNFSIAVKEKGEDVIFLRKIVEGGTDESYGIHVAKLAGVPKPVLTRANKILNSLEKDGKKVVVNEKEDKKQVEGQVDFFNYRLDEIAHELDKVNLNELTPIDALNILVKMKEKMQ